jgi:hypothetical protein
MENPFCPLGLSPPEGLSPPVRAFTARRAFTLPRSGFTAPIYPPGGDLMLLTAIDTVL